MTANLRASLYGLRAARKATAGVIPSEELVSTQDPPQASPNLSAALSRHPFFSRGAC